MRTAASTLLDAAGSRVVSTVTMRNGKFVSVGHDAGGRRREAGCKQVINLDGGLVIPGLVDNHNHIVLLGLRPGYHTPLETAANFADISTTYAQRIQGAPAGAFITTIGGFNPVQFAEKRLPNLAELDAIAPNNPVYLQVSFIGPSSTNTLGKAFFTAKGVAVAPMDRLLRRADRRRAERVAVSADVRRQKAQHDRRDDLRCEAGVTTHFDMGGFLIPGLAQSRRRIRVRRRGELGPVLRYEPLLELDRQEPMKVRIRVNYLSMDNALRCRSCSGASTMHSASTATIG